MPLSFTNVTIGSSQETAQDNQRPGNISQLVFVGTKQYRVTLAQLRVGDSGLVIQKFSGGVWSTVVDDAARVPAVTFCAAVQGSVIFIAGTDDFTHLRMWRFDTSTDTFLPTVSLVGMANTSGYMTLEAMPDGTLLVTANKTSSTGTLQAVRFDPLTGFGAPVDIAVAGAGAFFPYGACVDAGSGLCFIFYGDVSNQQIRCVPVDSTPTAYSDVLVFTPTLNGNTFTHMMPLAIGTPVVSGGKVCLPYLDPFFITSYADEINVARSTVGTGPVFSSETVQSVAAINLAYLPQTQNGSNLFRDLVAIDQAGVLYVFYVVDNGDLENGATSLALLYYNASTAPGVWSGPNLVYSGPLGSEAFSPFANLDASGNIALSLSWMNQDALFAPDQLAGLLTKYFYQVSSPVRFGNEFR